MCQQVYINDGWRYFHFSVCWCPGSVVPTKHMASSLLFGDITVKWGQCALWPWTTSTEYWQYCWGWITIFFSIRYINIYRYTDTSAFEVSLLTYSILLCSCICFQSHLSPVHLSLRDVLPFTLKLPEAIASATTRKELEEVAQLGAGSLICYLTGLIFCMNTQPHLS